jgi:hypothetical protein
LFILLYIYIKKKMLKAGFIYIYEFQSPL